MHPIQPSEARAEALALHTALRASVARLLDAATAVEAGNALPDDGLLGAFDAASFARLLSERAAAPAPAHVPPTPHAPAKALERVLPEGLVTFLATDIEGSTTRWERRPCTRSRTE